MPNKNNNKKTAAPIPKSLPAPNFSFSGAPGEKKTRKSPPKIDRKKRINEKSGLNQVYKVSLELDVITPLGSVYSVCHQSIRETVVLNPKKNEKEFLKKIEENFDSQNKDFFSGVREICNMPNTSSDTEILPYYSINFVPKPDNKRDTLNIWTNVGKTDSEIHLLRPHNYSSWETAMAVAKFINRDFEEEMDECGMVLCQVVTLGVRRINSKALDQLKIDGEQELIMECKKIFDEVKRDLF
jgi:hypothetical protein